MVNGVEHVQYKLYIEIGLLDRRSVVLSYCLDGLLFYGITTIRKHIYKLLLCYFGRGTLAGIVYAIYNFTKTLNMCTKFLEIYFPLQLVAKRELQVGAIDEG